MDLVIAIVAGLVVGAIAALKIIAPKTKTTKDDAVLAVLEKAEPFIESAKK